MRRPQVQALPGAYNNPIIFWYFFAGPADERNEFLLCRVDSRANPATVWMDGVSLGSAADYMHACLYTATPSLFLGAELLDLRVAPCWHRTIHCKAWPCQ